MHLTIIYKNLFKYIKIYYRLYKHLIMTIYTCPKCKKEFNRKCNYDYHLNNKKRPCISNKIILSTKNSILCLNTENKIKIPVEKYVSNVNENISNDLLFKKIDNMLNTNSSNNENDTVCMYCDAIFSRNDNLQRHMKERCKSKKYIDELEKLKEKLNLLSGSYQNLEKENENLKKENNELKNSNHQVTNIQNTFNNTNNINNINNGIINNNNVNIKLVQFGSENIDDLDIKEALDIYMKSTGGNIISNMLKFVNLNEKYPQNHNICMTDLSRELVKIFNGKQFIIKKFKNAKGDILCKVIKNTYKLVDKIENNNSIKKTADVKKKMKINNVSLKLIDDYSAEDIVREEIREKEKLLLDKKIKEEDTIIVIEDNDTDNDSDTDVEEVERDFTLEEKLRIEHLEDKKKDLQAIAFERLKEELYNGKIIFIE